MGFIILLTCSIIMIVFQVLSIQQLYRISTMYWDDKYGTHSVSPNVIANMKVLMAEDSNDALVNSFLLDDDLSIPFPVDDISKSMQETDLSDSNPFKRTKSEDRSVSLADSLLRTKHQYSIEKPQEKYSTP